MLFRNNADNIATIKCKMFHIRNIFNWVTHTVSELVTEFRVHWLCTLQFRIFVFPILWKLTTKWCSNTHTHTHICMSIYHVSQQQLKKKNVEPYCAFCQSTAANSIKVIMNFAFDLMCKDYTYPSASILTQRQRTSRISNQLLLTNTEKKLIYSDISSVIPKKARKI